MSKKKRISRILAIFLAASMVLTYNSIIPMAVWAANEAETEVTEDLQTPDPAENQTGANDSDLEEENSDEANADKGGSTENSDAVNKDQADAEGVVENTEELQSNKKLLKAGPLGAGRSETDPASVVNFERVLGRAAEYGILADTYEQINHSQTNFAVNSYVFRGYNDDPDIAGSHVVPFIIGKMEDGDRPGILFGSSTAEGKVMQYDIYTDKKYQETIDREIAEDKQGDQRTYIRLNDKSKVTTHMIYQDHETIKKNVDGMITHVSEWSNTLKAKTAIQLPANPKGNAYVLDTSDYPNDVAIYVDVPAAFVENTMSKEASLNSDGTIGQGFIINKKANQNIVLNIDNSSPVAISKMAVNIGGTVTKGGDENNPSYTVSPVNGITSDTTITESDHNKKVDTDLAQHLIMNFYGTGKVTLNTTAGCVLAPNADVLVKGSSAGWIASGKKVVNDGAEFHFIYHNRKYSETTKDSIYFSFTKEIWDSNNKDKGLLGKTYEFDLYKTGEDYSIEDKTPIQTKETNTNSKVTFDEIEITSDSIGTHYYVIKEKKAGQTEDNIRYWNGDLRIKIIVEEDGNGFRKTVEGWKSEQRSEEDGLRHYEPFVVNSPEITFGQVINTYVDRGDLELTKTIKGDVTEEEAEGALTFEVKTADGKWLKADGTLSDAKVSLTLKDFTHEKGTKSYTLKFEGIEVGDYTVTETTKDVTGKDVTVTYKVDGGEAKTGTEAAASVVKDGKATVAFEDDYKIQTGNLELKKTIKGDVTEEEAEGALTFEVKTKDNKWLKADGTLSDSKVELTLKDFTHKEGTKDYTLKFEDIKIGDYTVTETTKDITGKDVTVTYKVDGGEAKTGTEAAASVVKDGTATVAFEDDYKIQTGNLELKKTIKGDVTEEEAEGALTFEVKTKDNKWLKADGTLSDSKVELTLKDFTHKEGTKDYTLKFEGIKIGDYTVTETTKDITGKDVTVTYKVGDGKATEGNAATAEVAKDATTTVAFEDDYKIQTGNLELKKTIKGDVTEEEAEGALKFEVKTKDNKWLKADGTLSDSKVELTLKDFTHKEGTKDYTLKFEGIKIGDYTVTETTKDVTGKDVTVTYKVDGGEAKTGTEAAASVAKDGTATVAFEDDYKNQTTEEKGDLVITKSVDGDNLTESEFNGALKFTVQNEDGKYLKADGSLSDEKVELTLKDGGFVKGEDGKYTKTFKNVATGKYTVKETNSDVEGYDLVKDKSTTDGEATVEAGKAATVELKDVYEEKTTEEKKGDLVITKSVDGDNLTESEFNGALKFTVQNEDGKYLKADGSLSDEKVELTLKDGGFVKGEDGKYTKTFKNVAAGKYTVTETNSDVEGYNFVADKSVTDGEANVEEGKTATVELKDVYEKKTTEGNGNLVITKSVDGDNITESEFNGALKFEVKTADGKWLDKDGKVSDEKVELTLKDGGFVKGEDGKYTKTFKNVAAGKYTVTETNSDVEGYNFVADKSVTDGEANVEEGKTATVELKDVYEKKTTEGKGDLVITKTVGGNVTEEEIEKAALKFEVKTADGKWLDKDGKVSDTKVELTLGKADGFTTTDGGKTWTKTFKDVATGKYTVTETNSLIEGYTLKKDGTNTEATAEVKDGDKATAELTDEYEKDEKPVTKKTGDLIIKKTIEGKVTKSEIEKAGIKFEIRNKDGKWLDKNGKVSDEKVELTLDEEDGFTTNDGGKTWTKVLKDVPIDTYTVTETYSVIDGYEVTVVKKTSTAEVKEGEEAEADLEGVYEKDEESAADDEEDDDEKDDKKPSKGINTGDDAPFTAWLTLMLASLAGLAASVFNRRRSDRK